MAVSGTDQSQVCLEVEVEVEAEDLQSDPGQGDVGQEERTSVVVRNRDISGRSRQSEGEGVGRG